jgi:ubiquinone/menaquinone biosynthesis C-methylase UbiE
MTLATPEQNKAIYRGHHDQIIDKRFLSDSPIRRHGHRTQYNAFVELVPAGATVIDSGCGEGVLSVLLAKNGCIVTGVDMSEPNIAAAKKYAEEQGVADKCTFLVGDAEALPVPDKSFDYAVSSHVLEHVPVFEQGAAELARVARKQAVVAIPTCLNPCAWVLLGGDKYWRVSRRTPTAIFIGLARMLVARFTGEEGVNEGYAGKEELIHIWRFPAHGRRRIEGGGLKVVAYRGSSYIFPYFSFLVPLSKLLLIGKWWPGVRNWGYGTTYVCEPVR